MITKPIHIGIVAGETSGDYLGGHLIQILRQHLPQAKFVGIGGPKMQAAGFEALYSIEKLAVRGYIEVIKHFREIYFIRRKLKDYFLSNPPHLFIGIDAPDFNLCLEASLKQHAIPIVHYVSPSIWAWRGRRIHKIRAAVSHMLALFPFEEEIYKRADIPVTYVGHPLADAIPDEIDSQQARLQLRIPPDKKVIALLPGSRKSELHYMAATTIETAKQIAEKVKNVHFLAPFATRETKRMFENALFQNNASELPVTTLFGHSHEAMAAADIILVASGTATLEAALLKKPMVVIYKMAPLSWRIMRKMGYLPYVSLPNILAGEFIVPEFLQDDATPENISQALINLLNDKAIVTRLHDKFTQIRQQLKQNTAERVAQVVLQYVGR